MNSEAEDQIEVPSPPETQSDEHQISVDAGNECVVDIQTATAPSQTAEVVSATPDNAPALSPSEDGDDGNQKAQRKDNQSPKDRESSQDAGEKAKLPKLEDNQSSKDILRSVEVRQMFEVATKGYWEAAEKLLVEDWEFAKAKLSEGDETAFYVAVFRNHVEFIQQLIQMVGSDVFKFRDDHDNIPLHYAARNLGVVHVLAEADPSLVNEAADESQIAEVVESSSDAGNKIADPKVALAPTKAEDESQIAEEILTSMYEAAKEGDWEAAEKLLQNNPNLARAKLTDADQTAFHIAVLKNRVEFARKLIGMVGSDVLKFRDIHGNTPLHWAARDDYLGVVGVIVEKDSSLVNEKNSNETTPLGFAIIYRNPQVVEYLLRHIEGLDDDQLAYVVLIAITTKMFDVALEIMEKKQNLPLTWPEDDEQRSALHVLAQLEISSGDHNERSPGVDLSRKLWSNMKNSVRKENLDMVSLLKNPSILHDAAKVGNLDLIEMITRDYPDLLSHIYDGYSIFHFLVMHRNDKIFPLLKQARNFKIFNVASQENDDNNFLHSAAKSKPPNGLEIVGEQDVQMQRAHGWFKAVEAAAPPIYKEMRNKEGYTPEELFWKEHKELLSTSERYMKSTAESCMLISTIVLTLVFVAAFAPPGGFHDKTGIPILLTEKWFAIFIIFQVLALFSSTMSIIGFWFIVSSNYEQDWFFALPHYLRLSMCALLLSVLFVISAFLSAFFLVFVQERKKLVLSFMLLLYSVIAVLIISMLIMVSRKIYKISSEGGKRK